MASDKTDQHNPPAPRGAVLAKIPATYISYSHTTFAYCAFFLALIVGCYTHYHKIVRNEYYGYPEEWFPSVSATTGDWYPARAIFHIFIALTSGPRFALVYLWYLLITLPSRPTASRFFSQILLWVGLARTVSCGGWVYITSSDDHNVHDIAMISYLVLTIPWMFGVLATNPRTVQGSKGLKYRRYLCGAFFLMLVPMVYFFVQHKVHRVSGAYTNYAFFEWQLILYDVAFDAVAALEFSNLSITVVDGSAGAAAGRGSGASAGLDRLAPDAGVSEPITAQVAPPSRPWRVFGEVRSFVADVYLAFVFWSMLTSLTLLIWYFPLWHMGISGYEAFLLVTVSPVLLSSRFIRTTINAHRGLFHLLSLAGIASYLIVDPAPRLAVTAAGVSISILTWTATWVGDRDRTGALERGALVWILGLLVHNVVKMAWFTENPIWPIMYRGNGGKNIEGLVMGLLACLDVMMRGQPIAADSPTPKIPTGSWPLAATGLGSLLFALHSMYTDSSTVMRWVVDGYPNPGPEPVPWGVVTIAVLALGLFLSANRALVLSPAWSALGIASCAAFYALPAWKGYSAALVLAAYLVSLVPSLVRAVVPYPPGRTLFLATMTYNVLCLAHVWVVAYAFVPGGVYARERTNWLLATIMALVVGGVWNARTAENAGGVKEQYSVIRTTRRYARMTAIVVVMAATVVAAWRVRNAKTPQPAHPEFKAFTAGIWTIHFALDNDMWASERRMKDVIRDLELDVVGLLESDTQRIIMGNRDWAQYIAEDLGYYVDFGPATMKHTWGCLLLSKFPILRSTHHLLPSPVGELACAIHATLDVYGQSVDFIVSHNGQEEDELDRKLQTQTIASIVRESTNPFVFLGYVVTEPRGSIYNILFEEGGINDVDAEDWDRWCQYVGFRGVKRVAYARVSHGGISDTEIQTAKFQVVDDPKAYWGVNVYDRIDEWNIPVGLRYPAFFKSPGMRTHFYHVFDEPRYFGPKGEREWIKLLESFNIKERK